MIVSALINLATIVALALFYNRMKRDMRRLRESARDQSESAAKVATGLVQQIYDLEEKTGLLVPPTPPRSGLNLSKRTHALRLHRLGKAAELIAETVAVPRAEIELLVKVHQIVLRNAER